MIFGGSGVYIDTAPCDGGARVDVRALLDGVGQKQSVGLQIIDRRGRSGVRGLGHGEIRGPD